MTDGTISITTVTVHVPVKLKPRKRSRTIIEEDPHVSLEIGDTSCRVWDSATYTDCGKGYLYTRNPSPVELIVYPDNPRLTEIPYFAEVFRFMSEQYAANRTNPLGAAIRNMVMAMETDLAEKEGSSVYFAGAGDRVKIGWSKRVASRIAQLQIGNASPLRLLGTFPGGRVKEQQIHDMFAHVRVSGEWFDAAPDLMAYIESSTA